MDANSTAFPQNETLIEKPNMALSKSLSTFDTIYISLFLIYIPGIVTNIICIVILKIEERKTSMPTNVLLLCLCTTDLVAVCLSCFWHLSGRLGLEVTHALCAVKGFLHPLMPLLTGTISLLMAVDRVMAFCQPFFYRRNITKKTWIIGFNIILFLLCLISVLPHLGYGSVMTESYRRGKITRRCSVFTYQTDPKKKVFHSIYTGVGLFLIVGIIGCNLLVVVAVLRLRKRTVAIQKNNDKQRIPSKSTEIRFAVIVGVLACVFVTCWLPYNVWVLYKLLNIPMEYSVVSKIHLLGGFNYSTDPFVYLIIRKSNRKLLTRVFCCLGTRSNLDVSVRSDSTNKTFATAASRSHFDSTIESSD